MFIGIRQGDSLSPQLFNLVVNRVKDVGRGYRMGQTVFKILCYAVLIPENEGNLQRMLSKLYQTAREYNMRISILKTISVTRSKEPILCKLVLNNQPMSFEYLWIIVSSRQNIFEEVKTQANKAARVSGCL